MDEKLPEIRIIPIKDLLFHEIDDPKRTKRLEERIMSDGYLKNPIIVGRIRSKNPKFLLLDGVHRVSALRNLGFGDVPAQIVGYFDNKVKVGIWCHLIYDTCKSDLLDRVKRIPDLKLQKANDEKAESLLNQKKIVCYLLFKDDDVFVVKAKNDLKTRVSKLFDVVNVYQGSSTVKRGSEMENRFLLKEQEKAVAMLISPAYEKKEIVSLAFSSKRLPSGITRHIVPLRVLGFHVDLGLLKVEMPIEDKNKLIQQMLAYRISNGKTRFYRESVLIFDD